MSTLQLRTEHDLLYLLARGESPAWKVDKKQEPKIVAVQIVNWGGTQRIEATYDRAGSERRMEDGRLIVRFSDARIVNCNVTFKGRNPIRYLRD